MRNVGDITIRTKKRDGQRRFIKIEDPNIWIEYAKFVWIQNNGKIPKGFLIHHIDGDKLNDDIGNLAMMTRSAHGKLHGKQFAVLLKGKVFSEEHKKNLSKNHSNVRGKNHPMYGKENKWGYHTEETKQKMSESRKGIVNKGKYNGQARSVIINNKYFDTVVAASKFLCINESSVRWRINHKTKWSGYRYG